MRRTIRVSSLAEWDHLVNLVCSRVFEASVTGAGKIRYRSKSGKYYNLIILDNMAILEG